MLRLLTCVLLLLVSPSDQQGDVPISPCPNVFQYEQPSTEPGRWYGNINLSTDSTLHSLWLNIVLDRKADIIGNWVGDVTTTDNTDFKIENTKMMIHPGPAVSVRFFVQYNTLNPPTPKLKTIRLNGREICNADNPLPAVGRPTGRPVQRPESEARPQRPSIPRPTPSVEPQRPVQQDPVEDIANECDWRNILKYLQTPDESAIFLDRCLPRRQTQGSSGSPAVITPSQQPPRRQTTPPPEPEEDDNRETSFGGGIPTFIVPSSPSNAGNQGQCGRVLRQNPNPLVVGGSPTYEGEWPWQVAIYQTQIVDNKYICGGTLVSAQHVLTAAHCVTLKGSSRLTNKNTLTVYLGKHNLRTSVDGVQIRLVGNIDKHPEYNGSSYQRDIAILELRERVSFTEWVQPACLWPDDDTSLRSIVGKRGSVVGWGFDDGGHATEELSLVQMPVVDTETCIRSYSEFFVRFTSTYTFCAGYRNGLYNKDTGTIESTSVCNGDSGGGMVFLQNNAWHIRGIVSLSVAKQNEYRCDPSHYVVFTDVAKFLPWIKGVIGS